MNLGWAQVKIAGIEIKDDSGTWCKCTIQDKGKNVSSYTGSVELSANGTPDSQVFSINAYGRQIGVTIIQMLESQRDDILEAIESALPDPFRFEYEDDNDSGDYMVLPDWKAGWYAIAPTDRTHEKYVRDVTFRLITMGPGA